MHSQKLLFTLLSLFFASSISARIVFRSQKQRQKGRKLRAKIFAWSALQFQLPAPIHPSSLPLSGLLCWKNTDEKGSEGWTRKIRYYYNDVFTLCMLLSFPPPTHARIHRLGSEIYCYIREHYFRLLHCYFKRLLRFILFSLFLPRKFVVLCYHVENCFVHEDDKLIFIFQFLVPLVMPSCRSGRGRFSATIF